MPQTALQICNSALIKVGGRTIATYGETTTKEGELVTERFPKCLDMLTRGHVWAFLKVISTLAAVDATATTVVPWSWIHDLPTDLGRILSVTDGSGNLVSYERVGNTIYAEYDALVLRYVKRIDPDNYVAIPYDVGPPEVLAVAAYEFPDDFAESLACYLGADISVSLTQNADLHNLMLTKFDGLLRLARFNGAVERSDYAVSADDWMLSRYAYGDVNPYPNKLA